MKIIVLAGGDSPEREVSLRSGIAVSKALITLGHSVTIIDPVKPPTSRYFQNETELIEAFNETEQQPSSPFHLHPLTVDVLKTADTVFPALHGGIGEDGRLQAIMECHGISFTGSSSVACALSMNKALCKELYERTGIKTPLYTVCTKSQKRTPIPPCYPCVVKPVSGGSSIGVTVVHLPSALSPAIETAMKECDTVIMEELIVGRELSVSVLCDRPLAVTEIIPKSAFYDFSSKYAKDGAREITPAPLPEKIYAKALKVALNAHRALGMRNFSRTDLILESNSLSLYALETNALPGLTETSILPNAARSQGISFTKLIEMMLR